MATDSGHKTLTADSFVEVVDGEEEEGSVSEEEWYTVLEEEFAVQCDVSGS